MNTVRCLKSIRRNPGRWALRSAVSALALAALAGAGVLGVPDAPSASARSLSESASEECDAVDLLLLMDQSGSLNRVDPGGTERMMALNSIRSDFSGDDRWHVALIGFNEVPLLHSAGFRPAADTGQRHPSDDEIAEALPGDGSTYYGVALDAGLQVFGRAREDSCRHLVWFTDGLHDTAPGNEAEEVQEAEALRDKVCRVTAPRYSSEGVSTSVVLLGNSFEENLRSSDRNERRMAELSLDIIGIMTGERVIAGRPVDAACPTADLPQKGDVYRAGDIADLINSIIEATLPARGLLRWSDCDTSEGDVRESDNLPAGAFINEIQILSYRGAIDRYRLGQGQWIETSAGSRRIGLDPDALDHLAAGWELVIEVVADEGRDIGEVSLSCWSKPVGPLRVWPGVVQDGNGETVDVLLPDEPYILRVDMSPHECPVEALELRSDALASPLQYLRCESRTEALLHFDTVPAGGFQHMNEASGHMTPLHAGVLWGDRARIAVGVDVEPDPVFIPDRPLKCDQLGDSPLVERELLNAASRRIVAGECTVVPQEQGTVTVDIESPPGGPLYRLETSDGDRIGDTLTVGRDDGPKRVHIVSAEMGPQMLPIESHEVAVTARHQRREDGDALLADRQRLLVPTLELPLLMCEGAGSGGLAASSGLMGSLIEASRSAADSRSELVVGRCTLQPPPSGSRTLRIGDGFRIVDESGAPLLEPTTVTSGESPRSIVILAGLGDGRPPTDGELTLTLEQLPTEPGPPVLSVVHQLDPARLDAARDVRLTCGLEGDLPRIEAAAPFRVAAAVCRIEPPREGTLTVQASVAPSSPAYYVEAPEGSRFEETTIGSGDPPLRLRLVSESLGPAGWSTEGEVVSTVALAPGGGPALVAVHIVAVPELVLPSPLNCESMQFTNVDGDEVPSEPLEATLRCSSTWRGPDGQLTLAFGDGTGLLASDWRFLPASTLLNDGLVLRFDDGEEVTEVRLVTSGPLPNDRIKGDGTVEIKAQWMVPGWKEPLTGVTPPVQYSVDLWPRSVLWQAVLITLAAALLSWLLLYGVVAFKNRLPPASNFYARRFEISTYRDSLGGLRSAEIDRFNLEDHPSIPVSGDSNKRLLRTKDLRIDARRPRLWQIAKLLRGGWGEARAGQNRIVAVRPAGPRTRPGSTPEQFAELSVVALDSRSAEAEPRGVAYVLVPRSPSGPPDLRRDLSDALADLSGQRGTGAGAEPKPPRSERPR